MSVITWFFGPRKIKAAIELYMVEKQGVSLDDIRSIEFITTDREHGPVFDGVQVSFDDPGRRNFKSAARD